MPVGTPRTQAGVSIAIARDPSLVRTVRLVAAAVARRASSNEDLVEEVRLAVGEAVAVMVTGSPGDGAAVFDDKVRLQMDIGDRLFASLSCAGHGGTAYEAASLDPWALLRGLTDDLVVTPHEGYTTVSMSWPI
jgi:hypothetical protein